MKNKKKFNFLLMTFFILSTVANAQQIYKEGYQQGVFRIKIMPDVELAVLKSTTTDEVKVGIAEVDDALVYYRATKIKRVFPYSEKHEEKHRKHNLHLWFEIEYSSEAELNEVTSVFQNLSVIEMAEKIREKSLHKTRFIPYEGQLKSSSVKSVSNNGFKFDDPLLYQHYHYAPTGSLDRFDLTHINLFEAWEKCAGDRSVIVSVHDQGIDYSHEDLASNMWVNEVEMNGGDDTDNDLNGYKDDKYGYNFASDIGQIVPDMHGTHVAGTIAAVNNNGIGGAGIAGGTGNNDGVRLMSCQIFDGSSQGGIGNSFVYAADNGAVISQNSWGYTVPGTREASVEAGIAYFIEEAGYYEGSPMQGGIVIFAAGNSNLDADLYPGYLSSVITVAALHSKEEKASYSNYGDWITVSAPGGDMDYDEQLNEEELEIPLHHGIFSTVNNGGYGWLEGTSMATPHVSGIAALVVSYLKNNSLTNKELFSIIENSVDNVYGELPEDHPYYNKLGSGSINTLYSLDEKTNNGPKAITDLEISTLSQDLFELRFTVPETDYGREPVKYELYYSESTFNQGSLALIAKQEVDATSFDVINTSAIYELQNLSSLSEYYVGVVAVDKWGNKSLLSNIVQGTTTAGSVARLEVDYTHFQSVYNHPNGGYNYVKHNIDTKADPVANGQFILHNDGEGILKWNANIDYSTQTYWSDPISSLKSSSASQSQLVSYAASPFQTLVEYNQYVDTSYFKGYTSASSYYYIGEASEEDPSSSATRYKVETSFNDGKGFNLTHIAARLNVELESNEVILLEIYEGSEISTAKIRHRQELTTNTLEQTTVHALTTQLFFESGSYFWVVLHPPTGYKYPLAIAFEAEANWALTNCYYSSNNGRLWKPLNDVYLEGFAYMVEAISYFSQGNSFVTLSQQEGRVYNTDEDRKDTVDYSIDASNIINGIYNFDVNIATNDPDQDFMGYRIQTEIEGHDPVISGSTLIDFGTVVIGNEKHMDAYITNEGLGALLLGRKEHGDSQTLINGSKYSSISSVEALSSVLFSVGYKPETEGALNSYIRLYNSYTTEEYIIKVTGYAVKPPVSEMIPALQSFDDVNIGDEISGSFVLHNSGDYPLHYFIPKFADKPADFVGEVADVSKFGYFYESEISSDWEEISETGEEIAEIMNRASSIWVHEVELTFGFPFFGQIERKAYISPFSLIAFTDDGTYNQYPMMPLSEYSPSRAFCAMGEPLAFDPNINSRIFYQDFGDYFVVQYQDMPMGSLDLETFKLVQHLLTYQLVLYKTGNMEVRYKELDGFTNTLFWSVWAHDISKNDAIIANYHFDQKTVIENGTRIEIINSGLGLFDSITNASGIILSGDSVTLDYNINTENLNVDSYIEYLPILTNEPTKPFMAFEANINVTTGGDPDLNLTQSSIDFGTNFQLATLQEKLLIRNDGRAPGTINNIAITGSDADKFDVISSKTFPYDLPADVIETIEIVAKTDVIGNFNAIIELTLNNTESEYISLHSNVLDAPLISLSDSVVEVSLMAGEIKYESITISNSGLGALEYGILSTPIVYQDYSVLKSTPDLKDFQYQAFKQKLNPSVSYDWKDISSDSTKLTSMDLSTYDNFWNKVALPWSFNYYGIDYDTIYIGYCGVISFTEQAEPYARGDIRVPSEDGPNNIIAPMFGFVYNDLVNDGDAGVYFKAEEDEIIIQYRSFTDGFGMSTSPISWEVILSKEGIIKFQYDFQDAIFSMVPTFSAIGIENIDGTEGEIISFYSMFVDENTAIEFYPYEKNILQPGESASHSFVIDASDIYAGEYDETVQIINNTVANGLYQMPFKVIVDGESDVEIPTEIDFGEIFVVEQDEFVSTYNLGDESWLQQVELKNNGTKDFRIGKIFSSGIADQFKLELYTPISSRVGGFIDSYVSVDYLPHTYYLGISLNELPLVIPAKGILTGQAYLYKTPSEVKDMLGEVIFIDYEAIKDLTDEEKSTLTPSDIPEEYKYTITLRSNQIQPPAIALDKTDMSVYALDDSFVGEESVIISNTEGKYDLRFTLGVNFEYEYLALSESYSSDVLSTYNALAREATAMLETATKVKSSSSVKSSSENRVISQLLSDEVLHTFGWGSDEVDLHTVTKMVAPDDGFCLSQIEHYYTYRTLLEGYYTVQVFAGNDEFLKTGLIYSQRVNFSYDSPLFNNQVVKEIIDLDRPVMIQGGDAFFIRIIYSKEMISPAALGEIAQKDEEGNFFGSTGIVYRAVTELGVDNIGWMVNAIENEQINPQWLIPSITEGVIPVGDSIQVDFSFDASRVFNTTNKAKVYINSNDPNNTVSRVSAELIKNNGPTFNLDENFVIDINENDTLDFTLYANHAGSLDYTLRLAKDYSFVNGEFDGSNMNLQFTPDYFSAGVYAIIVEGEDSKGLISSFTFIVNINNVNRAPELIRDFDLRYQLDKHLEYTLDLTQYISDPDLEDLTYNVTKDNDNVELFYSNNQLIVKPLKLGTTTLTIYAEDEHGANISVEAPILIVMRVGIDEIAQQSLQIYPNPVKDVVSITSDIVITEDVNYKIVSVSGECVLMGKISSGSLITNINVDYLPKGIYLLELSSEELKITRKFTKL